MTIRAPILGLILIALTVSVSRTIEPEDDPAYIFGKYLNALEAADWAAAEQFWLPADIETSKRLGISYTDTPAKYDCVSPLTRALAEIQRGDIRVTTGEVVDHGDYAEIPVKLFTPSDSLSVYYFAVRTSEGWRLSSPLKVLTKGWNIRETEYIRIYYTDSSRINSVALQALDDFIETCAGKLGIPEPDLNRLGEAKIDYYLCNADQIKMLTGQVVQGMADLPSDAIVTRHLPHKHELTHLLVNYALRSLPLYTLPFMQEGVASFIGGRWEKSPRIICYTGYAVMKFDIARLDDILTFNDFHYTIGSADVSYPISALFVGWLFEKLDSSQWKQLYLDLSGRDREVKSRSEESVRSKIEQACGESWENIAQEFAAWWPKHASTGIAPASLVSDSQELLTAESDESMVLHDGGEVIYFTITIPEKSAGGFELIKTPGIKIEPEYVSRLFGKHLPDEMYQGEHYGLRFTPDEIGIYDYYCNELVASYVRNFSADLENPDDNHWNAVAGVYSFSVAKSVFNQKSIESSDIRSIVF